MQVVGRADQFLQRCQIKVSLWCEGEGEDGGEGVEEEKKQEEEGEAVDE
jgi:hypothetical protein